MKVRTFKKEDYDELMRWWEGHSWAGVPLECLPMTGLIVEDDEGEMLCAGFLYIHEAMMCHMEWIVSNPDNKDITSYKSLAFLVEELIKMAEYFEKGAVFTTSNNDALIRLFKRAGFLETDKDVTHLVLPMEV